MTMINDLIAQAAAIKEIFAVANRLANAQFEYNTAQLFQKPASLENVETEIKSFRQTIAASQLPKPQKNELIGFSDAELCSFASALTITFMSQEIKILD